MEPAHRNRLFRRLIVVSTSATIVLGAALTTIVAWETHATLVRSTSRDLLELTDRVATRSQVAVLSESAVIAVEELNSALRFPNVSYVAIYSASGRKVAERGDHPDWVPNGLPPISARIAHETSREWHVTAPITAVVNDTSTTIGSIHLVATKQSVLETVRAILLPTLLLSAAIAAGLAALVYRVTRDTTRTIGEDNSRLESSHRVAQQQTREAGDALAHNREFVREMYARLEKERRQITREIHDGLGARLVIARLAASQVLDSCEKHLSDSAEPTVRQARQVLDMVNEVYTLSRDILTTIRPDIIDAMGLKGAIEEMVEKWSEHNPACSYRLEISDDIANLGEESAISVYRIVQESLTNVTKHASAQHVDVHVALEEHDLKRRLRIEVLDDGVGFQPEAALRGGGLRGVYERAVALGGHAEFLSVPKSGTSIRVTIPAFDGLVRGPCATEPKTVVDHAAAPRM